MKYTVNVETYGEVSLEKGGDVVRLVIRNVEDDTTPSGSTVFSFDEFREFRRALGYVWSEVEAK